MTNNHSILEDLEQILKALDETDQSVAAIKVAEAIEILTDNQNLERASKPQPSRTS